MHKVRLRILLVFGILIGAPPLSFAQAENRVVVIPSVVFSYQSPEKDYASRYFSDHLNGFGWGGSVAVVGELRNFALGAEVNSARYSKEVTTYFQSPTSAHISFQGTFLSALFGYASSERTVQVVGGPGVTLGTPRIEGFPDNSDAQEHWFVMGGGLTVLVPSSGQIQFAVGARYFYTFIDQQRFGHFGIGKHALRASVGVSFGSAK